MVESCATRNTVRVWNGGSMRSGRRPVPANVLDQDIVASQAKIDPVLVQDRPSCRRRWFESAGLEVDVPQRAVEPHVPTRSPSNGNRGGPRSGC